MPRASQVRRVVVADLDRVDEAVHDRVAVDAGVEVGQVAVGQIDLLQRRGVHDNQGVISAPR